jgi:cell division septum initiation protein DivIVA
LPDNRSFLEIVNGARVPPSAPDPMPRRGRPIAATARAFAFPLSWSVTVCAGVAILALCAAIYGTIGYVDEKRIAVAERVAVEHAIRTNADLQRQLDRARDALPASGAQIETASAATEPKPTPTLAASAPTVIDRAPPSLIPALGQTDPRLPDLRLPDARLSDPLAANVAGLLRQDAAKASDSYIARLWARIAARDAEEQLERLAADYAELVDERDRLRERVRELEQSLSQAPQDSPQPAKGPPDNSFGPSSVKPGAAIIAFPGGAAGSEQAGHVYKNFNPPGSAPNYFSDESGAILGTHTSASRR